MISQYKSSSPLQTKNFAKKIARNLKSGDIIILSGELGAGKTTFTKGIVAYFNKNKNVKSPSFTITNIYKTSAATIYHFDFYRIENSQEQLNLFYEAYQKEGIFIIEWGEKVKDMLDEDYLDIRIRRQNTEDRTQKTEHRSWNKEQIAECKKNIRILKIYVKNKSKWSKIFQ